MAFGVLAATMLLLQHGSEVQALLQRALASAAFARPSKVAADRRGGAGGAHAAVPTTSRLTQGSELSASSPGSLEGDRRHSSWPSTVDDGRSDTAPALDREPGEHSAAPQAQASQVPQRLPAAGGADGDVTEAPAVSAADMQPAVPESQRAKVTITIAEPADQQPVAPDSQPADDSAAPQDDVQQSSDPDALPQPAAPPGSTAYEAAAARYLHVRQPRTNKGSAESQVPPSAEWSERSHMRCVGRDAETRVCLFQDVVYDSKERRWLYFGSQAEWESLRPPVDTPFLSLQRCALLRLHDAALLWG